MSIAIIRIIIVTAGDPSATNKRLLTSGSGSNFMILFYGSGPRSTSKERYLRLY